jgi:hypoxanthine phosphoribosyltransferase
MVTATENRIRQLMQRVVCLHDKQAVDVALDRMAAEMTEKLQHKNPLLLCVMIGAVVPAGHLLTRLSFPLEVDYIHATRYRGSTRPGDLHWLVEPRQSLKNRTVVIIDDVMDGGRTLAAIIDYCCQMGAAEVLTAVMVNKLRERDPGVTFVPDFVGVETEDKFLVGFGLDYAEYMRNLPGIYAIPEDEH